MGCTILVADADPLLGERMADTLQFYGYPERTVDKHVAKLRWKFERDPRTPRLFLAVVNVGYCFMPGEEVFITRS